ncbi:thioredoxin domain-containing protein [Allosphingosinicella sp.]|jgi:protein-disulfide isomerase|uniref:thioredoxin domain-containing protein n=1 Tax=Allosphingosinicella sp. TaxID=2823234 RepID=UPI002F1607AB
MKISIRASALALALLVAGCSADEGNNATAAGNKSGPITPIPAPNNADWTQIVTQTPEGGVRMGNPDAPVKLVEYASITCPHCAEFSNQGSEPLKTEYVRSGRVSWEYRPYMVFPTDPGIFMLLRCQPPTAFFQMAEQLYRDNSNWSARVQTMTEPQAEQLRTLPPVQQAAAFVDLVGLREFFRARGMTEARINSCLANSGDLDRLTAMTQRAANEERVTGTPTFLINGEIAQGVGDWGSLEPVLRASLGG